MQNTKHLENPKPRALEHHCCVYRCRKKATCVLTFGQDQEILWKGSEEEFDKIEASLLDSLPPKKEERLSLETVGVSNGAYTVALTRTIKSTEFAILGFCHKHLLELKDEMHTQSQNRWADMHASEPWAIGLTREEILKELERHAL
jgi:hypothetical protein